MTPTDTPPVTEVRFWTCAACGDRHSQIELSSADGVIAVDLTEVELGFEVDALTRLLRCKYKARVVEDLAYCPACREGGSARG